MTRIIDDITKFIFVRNELEQSDIIFIPGGSQPELGEYAAALYKEGFAEKIMPTGRFSIKTGRFGGVKSKKEIYSNHYVTECDFLSDVLRINGVPEDAVIRECESGYTKENAFFSKKILDAEGIMIRKAIICCKNYHARRSLMYFQLAFPHVDFFVHPVPYARAGVAITADNWFKTEAGIRRVTGEMQRCGSQFYGEFINLLDSDTGVK